MIFVFNYDLNITSLTIMELVMYATSATLRSTNPESKLGVQIFSFTAQPDHNLNWKSQYNGYVHQSEPIIIMISIIMIFQLFHTVSFTEIIISLEI